MHTLIWAVDDPSKLSAAAMSALQDPANERLLSAATIWELAIKYGQGKVAVDDGVSRLDGGCHPGRELATLPRRKRQVVLAR